MARNWRITTLGSRIRQNCPSLSFQVYEKLAKDKKSVGKSIQIEKEKLKLFTDDMIVS